MRKPDELHARDQEWGALVDFVTDPSVGATLGLVYGRRRQGKTLMLELLAEATGGFMFTAREQSERQNLQELSAAYARHAGLPASLAFDNWPDAIDALLGLGSASSEAPELAFRVHALLGGTPAYRAMAFGPPADRESFDQWVVQRLLNPASALFREGNLLLREESGVTDPAPYHGVLAAIAAGAARRSEIAGRIGRPATAIAHLLAGLQQVGLVARLEDAFRERRYLPPHRPAHPAARVSDCAQRTPASAWARRSGLGGERGHRRREDLRPTSGGPSSGMVLEPRQFHGPGRHST